MRKEQRQKSKENKKSKILKESTINIKRIIISEFEFTYVIRSKITGKYYNNELHKDSWHHSRKLFSAKRLAKMFNFKLEQNDTLKNILNAIQKISDMYHIEKLSSLEIAKRFNLNDKSFHLWMKATLQIKLRSVKDAVNNYCVKTHKSITDEKEIYYKKCKFTFDPYLYKDLPGYDLLLEKGIYHPINNPNGVCRDHMISINYGWINNIGPEIIAHPANCQYLTNIDNIKKGSGCILTLDELIHRIENNLYDEIIVKSYTQLPKSEEHKRKISETNRKFCTVTNGIINLRLLKTDPVPEGFWKGMTRNKKNGQND